MDFPTNPPSAATHSAAGTQPGQPTIAPPPQTSNVLLVDDDPNILSAMIRSFRRETFQVFTAHSGEEAMDIIKRTRVDAIVTDENMKGMRGTELLCWVREHLPEIPRIVLTGQPNLPSMETAINQAGVFRYLTKPFPHEQLAHTIHDALNSRPRKS